MNTMLDPFGQWMLRSGKWFFAGMVLVLYAMLVAGHAGEANHKPVALNFVSDCFVGGMLSSEVRSYAAWPEPSTDGYILTVGTPQGIHRYCWKDQGPRDRALTQVQQAMGSGQ